MKTWHALKKKTKSYDRQIRTNENIENMPEREIIRGWKKGIQYIPISPLQLLL